MFKTFLSSFTPSLSQPETLEAITVGRKVELSRIVELIADSVNSSAKHHILLVGPRGIGKTHHISLINYYLRKKGECRSRMLIVWLKEEEWGVSSFLDFIIRILRNLAETDQTALKTEEVESLFDSQPEEAELLATRLLKESAKGKTIVLLAENLDEIFKGLSESGQQKLRSFIQENPFISIVATTQSLFTGVTSQTEPFYGFFRVYHLAGLSFAEAVEMLIKIAELRKDEKLAAYLKTPEGRARVRAIHHLVGGNPRLYVIFSEFLDRTSIENLITPFMKMLDELTPYYQERMRSLSQQQRQIVEIMCDAGKPLTVKEIARRAFITPQTASSQLKQLRESGYACSKQFGRESLYELCEPLMRLTVEVKKNRGKSVRRLACFLRLWYSTKEIETKLEMPGGKTSPKSEFLKKIIDDVNLNGIRHHLELIYKQFEDDWNNYIPRIIVAYKTNDLLHRLGPALVKFLFRLLQAEGENKKVGRWISIWQNCSEAYPELAFSSELLETAWQYASSGEESVLYNLPIEERKMITDFGDFN